MAQIQYCTFWENWSKIFQCQIFCTAKLEDLNKVLCFFFMLWLASIRCFELIMICQICWLVQESQTSVIYLGLLSFVAVNFCFIEKVTAFKSYTMQHNHWGALFYLFALNYMCTNVALRPIFFRDLRMRTQVLYCACANRRISSIFLYVDNTFK